MNIDTTINVVTDFDGTGTWAGLAAVVLGGLALYAAHRVKRHARTSKALLGSGITSVILGLILCLVTPYFAEETTKITSAQSNAGDYRDEPAPGIMIPAAKGCGDGRCWHAERAAIEEAVQETYGRKVVKWEDDTTIIVANADRYASRCTLVLVDEATWRGQEGYLLCPAADAAGAGRVNARSR